MAEIFSLADFGFPTFKYRQMVAASVPKWFADLNAKDHLVIMNIYGSVTTAEPGATLTFTDEDSANTFLVLPIALAGVFQYHDLYLQLPMGKDIRVAHSGTSGVVNLTIVCARRPYLP